jgi:hypothetical protein
LEIFNPPKNRKNKFKKKNHHLKSEFFLSLFTKKIFIKKTIKKNNSKSTEKSQRGGRPTAASHPKSLLETTKIERPLDKRELGSTCENASESGLQ